MIHVIFMEEHLCCVEQVVASSQPSEYEINVPDMPPISRSAKAPTPEISLPDTVDPASSNAGKGAEVARLVILS